MFEEYWKRRAEKEAKLAQRFARARYQGEWRNYSPAKPVVVVQVPHALLIDYRDVGGGILLSRELRDWLREREFWHCGDRLAFTDYADAIRYYREFAGYYRPSEDEAVQEHIAEIEAQEAEYWSRQ